MAQMAQWLIGPATQLLFYLSANNLLPPLQPRFRQFHSTEIDVLKVYNDLVLAADKGYVTRPSHFKIPGGSLRTMHGRPQEVLYIAHSCYCITAGICALYYGNNLVSLHQLSCVYTSSLYYFIYMLPVIAKSVACSKLKN